MLRFLIVLAVFLNLGKDAFAQTKPDVIYRTDRSTIEALVDEIGETQIVYFLPKDVTKTPRKINKTQVWKVVYANGDVEQLNQPLPVATTPPPTIAQTPPPAPAQPAPVVEEKPDLIYLINRAVLEGTVLKISDKYLVYKPLGKDLPSTIPIGNIEKVRYANSHVEEFEVAQTKATKKEKPSRQTTPRESREETTRVRPPKDAPAPKPERVREPRPKNYVSLLVGGVMSGFYRDELLRFPEKPPFGLEAGLAASLVSTRYYQMRLEGSYLTKGANEVFAGRGISIESQTRLTYVQGTFFPIILKTGYRGVNLAAGAGGYYGYLIGMTSQYSVDEATLRDDTISPRFFTNKSDYGVCTMAGIYYKQKPILEARYSFGMTEMAPNNPLKNHAAHLTLFISF
ncbi:MAG: outer membrane beta-barrel protein [Runella sp.]